jgi:hypothetical protein
MENLGRKCYKAETELRPLWLLPGLLDRRLCNRLGTSQDAKDDRREGGGKDEWLVDKDKGRRNKLVTNGGADERWTKNGSAFSVSEYMVARVLRKEQHLTTSNAW